MGLLDRTSKVIIDNFYDSNVGRILSITCCACGEWRVGKITCECGKVEIDITLDEMGYPIIISELP